MFDLPMSATRFRDLSDRLRAGYWFLPMMMAIGAVAGALLLVNLDETYFGRRMLTLAPNSVLDTASFRDLANLVATSTLAFLGVLFSIILVPLSIAAGQLGPQVLRTFLRNTGTQAVLGLFIGNAFFSLTLMAAVPDNLPNPPALSSIALLLLFMASIAALVYFIHEVAQSLQANTVIMRLSAELEGDIRREMLPYQGSPADFAACEAQRKELLAHGLPIRAQREGFVRAIDFDGLVRLATAHRTTMATQFEPGDFIMRGDPLVHVPPATPVDEALIERVNRQFLMGEYRTITQDIDFGLISLVSVASRALSAAINDPFTAILCIQRLGAALAMIAERGEHSHHLRDAGGALRVLGEPDSFEEHVNLSFHPIRQYGRSTAEVLMTMLRIISRIAERTQSEEQRSALRLHADLIDRDARAGSLTEYDATRVRLEYDQSIAAIDRLSEQDSPSRPAPPADDL